MKAVPNSYKTEHFPTTLKKSVSPEGVSELKGEKKTTTKKKQNRILSQQMHKKYFRKHINTQHTILNLAKERERI